MSNNDFYMILPSNACEKEYPRNNASSYRTALGRSINLLQGNWKVGITEISYYRDQLTASAGSGFEVRYEPKQKIEQDVQLADPFEIFGNTYSSSIQVDNIEGRIRFRNLDTKNKSAFKVIFANKESSQGCGFKGELKLKSQFISEHGIRGNLLWMGQSLMASEPASLLPYDDEKKKKNKNYKEIKSINFKIIVKVIVDEMISYKFPNAFNTDNAAALAKYMSYGMLCSKPELNVKPPGFHYEPKLDRFACASIDPNITVVNFLNGYHFVLGYSKPLYGVTEITTVPAAFAPQLIRGVGSMYIYSNLCQNIIVGDTYVPLLRQIVLPAQQQNYQPPGLIEKVILDYPMYVPVAVSSINCIEIEIRTNNGDYFPFSPGSVTTITLHFKKHG